MTAETEQVQHTPGWTVRTSTRLAGGLPADGLIWVHDVVTAEGETVCQVDAIDANGTPYEVPFASAERWQSD